MLAPFFLAIGSDPSIIAGMFLGVDAGGLPLAQSLAHSHEAAMLSGLGLGGTLGCILTFALPISLSSCSAESRPYVAKGLVAGIIAAPFSLFGVGLIYGFDADSIIRIGFPAFVMAGVLALCLTFFREATVRGCILLGRVLMGIFVILLAISALNNYFSIELIPHMAPIGKQLEIVGEIGIMLSGAFPMVRFIKNHFDSFMKRIATLFSIDETAALGMIVSIANPLPMYVLIDKMSKSGKVVCSAFSGPILCLLGDHLGFITAYYPEGTAPLLFGKILSASIALAIGLVIIKTGQSRPKANS